ncbi:MAG: AAA family ATPase [Bacteroidales bacterium]|jgi:hypothetical protein|nr:AAA family ATPase [Bacteroidales bacterium]
MKLKKMLISNFRGISSLDFTASGRTLIKGDNGTGKSTVADAFFWCLFGKDTNDRKDYEVRPLDADNNPLHNVGVMVSVTLSADGVQHILTRRQVEKWHKPKGQSESIFAGNETKCEWNDVPVSVSEYSANVEKLLPADLFKVLSNPLFFCNMDWRKMREYLFELFAGSSEAGAKLPRLPEWINDEGYIERMKKELSAAKTRIKDKIDTIPVRIDQTNKMLPPDKDWAAIEKEIDEVNKQITVLQISGNNDLLIAAKRKHEEAKLAYNTILNKEQQEINEHNNRLDVEVAKRNAALRREDNKENEQAQREHNIRLAAYLEYERKLRDYELSQKQIRSYNEILQNLRDEYTQVVAEQFDDSSTMCPHCGQTYPADKTDSIKAVFQANKTQRLADIISKSEAIKSDIQAAKMDKPEEVIEPRATFKMHEAIEVEHKQYAPSAEAIRLKELADSAFRDVIEIEGNNKAAETKKKKELQRLEDERTQLINSLSDREQREKGLKEIQELVSQNRVLNQELADIEAKQQDITDYIFKKIQITSESINGFFENIKFKLFDTTINGDLYECCIPLINGVPFAAANTTGRMNAGLEIIEVLCRHYAKCTPIFIDNTESYNEIYQTASQQILLQFAPNVPLTITTNI